MSEQFFTTIYQCYIHNLQKEYVCLGSQCLHQSAQCLKCMEEKHQDKAHTIKRLPEFVQDLTELINSEIRELKQNKIDLGVVQIVESKLHEIQVSLYEMQNKLHNFVMAVIAHQYTQLKDIQSTYIKQETEYRKLLERKFQILTPLSAYRAKTQFLQTLIKHPNDQTIVFLKKCVSELHKTRIYKSWDYIGKQIMIKIDEVRLNDTNYKKIKNFITKIQSKRTNHQRFHKKQKLSRGQQLIVECKQQLKKNKFHKQKKIKKNQSSYCHNFKQICQKQINENISEQNQNQNELNNSFIQLDNFHYENSQFIIQSQDACKSDEENQDIAALLREMRKQSSENTDEKHLF